VNREHALYRGHVWHRRQRPAVHEFRYPFWWLWINLDDIDGLLARHPWWGRRWRAVTFREQDYLHGKEGLRDGIVAEATRLGLDWNEGEVCLLSQPRIFGWCFNPLSLYWHFPVGSDHPDSVIAEVHNTPWNERHWYALPLAGEKTELRHEKAFHVSPFMPMEQDYAWQFQFDADSLSVVIKNIDAEGVIFSAGLSLTRHPAYRGQMTDVMRVYGAQGMKVSAAIYAHAWRLWRKGVAFVRHPKHES
jgi:hypothetical protein